MAGSRLRVSLSLKAESIDGAGFRYNAPIEYEMDESTFCLMQGMFLDSFAQMNRARLEQLTASTEPQASSR